jgi:glucose/arabinose dehydrogenase
MTHDRARLACLILALGLIAGCGGRARLTVEQGMGPTPAIPEPRPTLIPTMKIAPAIGWPTNTRPTPASGLSVNAFASGLEHPRWLYVLPNGDVLVAESNAPAAADAPHSLKSWVMRMVMKRAGAAVPSPDRIVLIRDADGDGVAETRTVFLDHLHSPFGMALVGDSLYVANTDAVMRFPYHPGDLQIAASGEKLLDLPAGPIDHHWTKNIIADQQGTHLYATIGSNSNVGENGLDNEVGRAAIWEIELASGKHRPFATGLRNPNGLAWEPNSGALWTVVNERDELGSDLVPDYLTSVREHGFYGWPYSYFGQHVDTRVQPAQPALVATALVPDYALGPHTASLGLAYSAAVKLTSRYATGMFIGQHGSWNRKPRSGYKVVFVPFAGGQPAGAAIDVLTGFTNRDGKAYGRPVGVAIHTSGALLVADDVGNTVWRVSAADSAPRR